MTKKHPETTWLTMIVFHRDYKNSSSQDWWEYVKTETFVPYW